MVFSSLPFGNHFKKSVSNFNQELSFLPKSNLRCLFVFTVYCSLMRALMGLRHKDFTVITGNAFF